jgi:hypothetical protein
VSDTYKIDTWLYSVLHGDSSLVAAAPGGIYADMAPLGVTGVYVTYALMAGSDVLTISGVRMLMRALYVVRATGEGNSYSVVTTAADRIDALLKRTSGSTSGGLILSCVREEPVRYGELVDGKQFRHLGGLYRIQIEEV